MSASAKKPWTRFIKRAISQGGGGGKDVPSFRGEAAYVARLRRLELVLLHLSMKRQLPSAVLDKMLEGMLDLSSVVEPKPGRRGTDERREAEVPQVGAPSGEVEDETDSSV